MAKGIFKLSGIDEYMEQIQQAGFDILEAAEEAVEAGAEVALDGMLRRVPEDTGNLKSHLDYEITVDGDRITAEIGVMNADAETARYGNVQEFGSATTPEHSYVRSTMDEDKRKIRKAMRDKLKGFVK